MLADPSSTSSAAPAPTAHPWTKKRSSRACDGCKTKRMKCDDVRDEAGRTTCRVCREAGTECAFEAPVRKRGPAPGFKRQARRSSSPTRTPLPVADRDEGGSGSGTASPAPKRRVPRAPFLGLPPALVDQLLAVYFTHVHNVWPLIYKPLFSPHTVSSPLLLSMLAIAVCVSSPLPTDGGVDGDALFRMAESSLHHCRQENRVDLIQALILLSLRQTGCGDKNSAFAYAGRACCMALNLGLNLAPTHKGVASAEDEIRSRVYWNCYVLDKTLAEETGRPFLLPYRRTTVPLPSSAETDELETWPPLPTSSAPLPQSVRHVDPRRGHVMSYFAWTCRLAMVVEDILDLECQVAAPATAWDAQFLGERDDAHGAPGGGRGRRHGLDARQEAQRIDRLLDAWRVALPPHLEVDMRPSVSPLPHHIINMAWFYTSKILLFSRFVKRSPVADADPFCARAHAICSDAAQAVIDLFGLADRFKLLNQVSSDIIHLLSLATLFEAFDSTDPDERLSRKAKLNFAQCCIWLRDFSSSWPAASTHKLFFEGLIQGGLKLSSPDDGDARSPSVPDGLRQMGHALVSPRAELRSPPSLSRPGSASTACAPPPPAPLGPLQPANTSSTASASGGGGGGGGDFAVASASALFSLPQFYWNHLSTNAAATHLAPPHAGAVDYGSDALGQDTGLLAFTSLADGTGTGAGGSGTGTGNGSGNGAAAAASAFDLFASTDDYWAAPRDSMDAALWPALEFGGAGGGSGGGGGGGDGDGGAGGSAAQAGFASAPPGAGGPAHAIDQAAIYSALMSYMLEAAKTG
ncbi:hypothetical protein Q5752_006458 [Cryptotrichosporon argae]